MDERLGLPEFEACAERFDHAVERQRGIDRFCSRSEWILPFHLAFRPDREIHIYRRGESWLALAAGQHPNVGLYLEALETMWCFACPLVGDDAPALLRDVRTELAAENGGRPPALLLSGIPTSGDLTNALVAALGVQTQIGVIDLTQRFVASLEGGIEDYLSRRSSSFRRNLRAAARRASDEYITFETTRVDGEAEARAVYARVLEIEATSWKGAAGTGADQEPMRSFYAHMLPRLARRGAILLTFAFQDRRAIGYLYGGLIDTHFRGLQMSYDAKLSHLSLGNLLQLEMIERLCERGVKSYDLGSSQEYKRRFAEEGLQTATLICRTS